MEKTNIRRLIGVMMPFMIMVILQRLGLLLTEMTPLGGTLRELLAFGGASAAGIFFFRMSCGAEALRLTDGMTSAGKETGGAYDDGDVDDGARVPPFPARDTLFGCGMYTLIGVGVLIVTMHVVTVTADAQVVPAFAPGTAAAEFVSLVLIHPFLEEYLFRWLYYRELRPMQPIFAGLAQAVMFAIVHGSVGGMIYALFAGVVLAFVMEQSGSLGTAVLSHMLVNLRSFVYLTWLADGTFAQAERLRLMIDFALVSLGFGALLVLMVRRGLREVWKNAEEDDEENDENEDITENGDSDDGQRSDH